MENIEEKEIIEENLKRIFDAVNWIKTDDNSKMYDACESHDSVRMALSELPNIKMLLSEMPSISLERLMNHDWQGYAFSNCIAMSLQKTQIYFNVAKEMNVDLGFTYEDLERLVLQISLYINSYSVPLNGRGDVVPCSYQNISSPLFTANDLIEKETKLNADKVKKMLDIFAIDLYSIKEKDADGLLKIGEKYCAVYPDFFVMSLGRLLDETISKRILESKKDVYYKNRGDAFEGYLTFVLIDFFGADRVFPNVEYRTDSQKNELDAVLELDEAIIIFEAKSSKYDEPYNFYNDESKELLYGLKNSFGRGFKTLDRAYSYFSSNKEVKLYKGKESKTISTKGKSIFTILFTLNDIRSIGGRISKICKDTKIVHFPACLSCCDFQTIMANVGNPQRLCTYLKRKNHFTNDLKMLTFDIDEVDAYGMMMSEQYNDLESRLSIMKDINCNFMVGNSCYRQKANEELNALYLNYLIAQYTNISPRNSNEK